MAVVKIEIPDDIVARVSLSLQFRYPKDLLDSDLDYIAKSLASVVKSYVINKEGGDAAKVAAAQKRTELSTELSVIKIAEVIK